MKAQPNHANALLLLARSKPASDALRLAARAQGLALAHCALVESEIATLDGELAHKLQQARRAHWLVFVSPNAVAASAQLVPELSSWPGVPCAVGTVTAQALQSIFGQRDVLVPRQGEGALALLQAPELQAISQQTLAIFTAPDGLTELRDGVYARGAHLLELIVYKRRMRTLSDVETALCHSAKFAYVGSGAFLQALMAARNLTPLTLFVPSQRVAALAERYGCQVQLCENSSEAALISQIQQMQW
jgi:uroporphyrinogen-III synthase